MESEARLKYPYLIAHFYMETDVGVLAVTPTAENIAAIILCEGVDSDVTLYSPDGEQIIVSSYDKEILHCADEQFLYDALPSECKTADAFQMCGKRRLTRRNGTGCMRSFMTGTVIPVWTTCIFNWRNIMPDKNKQKYAFWLRPETAQLADEMYRRDNCGSRSEYMEKAIRFYTGYISEKDSSQFLSHTLAATLRGTLDDSENRIARLLFKLAVEVCMMTHVLASGLEIGDDEMNRLRARCVAEVKRTKGRIGFEDAVNSMKDL